MKIAIIGAGRIGRAAYQLLRKAGFNPVMFDIPLSGGLDHNGLVWYFEPSVYDDYDIFLLACPFEATMLHEQEIAKYPGKLAFDLTEDVGVGAAARAGSKSVMVPHCGVAPGAVSIIAKAMLPAKRIIMRVGAIPQKPIGQLGYSLTWSTNGLVNEYSKPCPAILSGQRKMLVPMADLQDLGDGLEAFNTSGGIGTFAETQEGNVDLAVYQTIRYSGHRDLMLFLMDDMGFRGPDLVELLDRRVPRDLPDEVVVLIESDKAFYRACILPQDGLTAIERATASGAVAVMQWCIGKGYDELQKIARPGNWIANEDIPLAEIEKIETWSDCYGVRKTEAPAE
jgi:hypothetical protein